MAEARRPLPDIQSKLWLPFFASANALKRRHFTQNRSVSAAVHANHHVQSAVMTAKPRAAAKNWKFWTAGIAGANVLHLWLFFNLRNAHLVQFWTTVAIHSIACIGPFWMLAHWFNRPRNKLQWQRWMWLFFVP